MPTFFELWDGRRGRFYTSWFTGAPMFQEVDEAGCDIGDPELRDAEDHALMGEEPCEDDTHHPERSTA